MPQEISISCLALDLHRYVGSAGLGKKIRCVCKEPGARYILFFRLTGWLHQQSILFKPLCWLSRLFLRHYTYKYGISIPYNTCVEPGFYIGHFGGIVVHPAVHIGKNCILKNCIVDKGALIHDGTQIGVDLDKDRERFHVTEEGIVLVTPGMLNQRLHFERD